MSFDFLTGMTALERIFLFCAVGSGIVFIIRIILLAVGVGHGHTDLTPHMDAAAGTHIVGDSDTSFQLLSIQGLTAFFMMFGLVGLTLLREMHATAPLSILGGIGAGIGTMFIIAYITSKIWGLQSTGTIDVMKAVGEEGTVYLSIPASGTGQAQITLQNRMRIYDAVSEDKQPIASGDRIKVTQVTGGRTLVVKRV